MSKALKTNKFDVLIKKIPKNPEIWDEEDITIWLQIIGMEQYTESFRENKVDGLTILDLKEDEIEEELKITTKLHKKKVVKAIDVLKEYQVYFLGMLDSHSPETSHQGHKNQLETENFARQVSDQQTKPQEAISQRMITGSNVFSRKNGNVINDEAIEYQEIFSNNNQNQGVYDEENQIGNNLNLGSNQQDNLMISQNGRQFEDFTSYNNRNNAMPNQQQQQNLRMTNLQNAGNNNFSEARFLKERGGLSSDQQVIFIHSIEGNNEVNHQIDESGSKIGRHSSNQVVIFDESVSRYHAEISFSSDNNRFMLKDIGSTSGTFVKIVEAVELKLDMIIEIGSYQLMVTNIFIANSLCMEENLSNSYVEFTIYESPEDTQERVFNLISGNSIGRKVNNALCFSDDLHMSNLHCKISLIGQRFIFDDMESTNGSWLRLSKEGVSSRSVPLFHKTIFKIGNSAMYEVFVDGWENKEPENNVGQPQSNLCIICWDVERDCLILPCRHNVSCTKCIKSIKKCPVCREDIKDMLRIYKS